MIGYFKIAGRPVRIDFARARSIAIPLEFDGAQPNFFGAARARRDAMRVGGFVGDTRAGGSCNVSTVTLTPHCNGTHTECVGHIVDDPVSIDRSLCQTLLPAVLITLDPIKARETSDAYRPALTARDRVMTREQLAAQLSRYRDPELAAVVIRTVPNGPEKKSLCYGGDRAHPFLTLDAIDYLNARGVRHLLVDVPSLDRMHDDGLLSAHRRFWHVPEGSRRLTPDSDVLKTVTELAYVSNDLQDGVYLLDLQVPPFSCDAAPSRPILYPVEDV